MPDATITNSISRWHYKVFPVAGSEVVSLVDTESQQKAPEGKYICEYNQTKYICGGHRWNELGHCTS